MQDSSSFQYIAIDQIHESTTNPRQSFDESKLQELAESIRQHGLIQPITVRPNSEGFEIVAGARRYRAAHLAELFSVPARIVELNDAQAMEWQLVENSQRVDVHPYEEAQGFQRLLDIPGYDVTALVEKSGKSASHIYARLSLLQLIPAVAEAFRHERITASHANLIARLPHDSQAEAFENCWRKDWQDKEPHLLPAKHLSAWIQTNLYLALADAPFDRDDDALNPAAGACTTCPRRSGFNTSLFCDVQGDQCLDSACYHSKTIAHIDRELAARPALVQIETAWRNPKEQRPGALTQNHFRQLPGPVNEDAEPACSNTRTAIIVFGKGIGTTTTVCTDTECEIHDPRQTRNQPKPAPMPAHLEEPEEGESQEERAEREQQRQAFIQQQENEVEQRRQDFERQQQEYEAERTRRAELQQAREATLQRIIEQAPATLSAKHLRILLRAIVNLDPYTFTDDLAEELASGDENDNRGAEEILLSAIDNTSDERLSAFAIRLALTGHVGIPTEDAHDFLTEAEAAFAPEIPKKGGKPKLVKTTPKKTTPKKTATKRKAA